LHVWRDDWVGQGDWLETVQALRDEGKIRFFGVSINDHEPANALKLIETGVVDTVQVIYNVFDQSPEDELFRRAWSTTSASWPACRSTRAR
jgi:aryl-alcohol dehydrogenase-like predicted oxidoreductase